MGLPAPASPQLPRGHLYLIDTMGYIFRAFHALPPLSNRAGLPTQAVLGFINMLRKLIQDAEPQELAAVYDLAGPTFRDAVFEQYKANRPAMPETLAPQLPHIRRALEAFGVPVLEAPGFEADDIIGTVARQAAAQGRGVVIVSSDKDLLQLVDDNIRVYNPGHNVLYDAAAVTARLGVSPAQVPDYLALLGDAVDNIPGAPGIGEKGAQQLIARFGSVEQALEHAAEVERKTYRESLGQNRDQILLSKSLATIHTAAPVVLDLAAWRAHSPDLEACRALFAELDFHHLLRALPAPGAPPPPVVRLPAPGLELDAGAAAALLAANTPVALAWGGEGRELGIAAGDVAGLLGDPSPLLAALAAPGRHWRLADAKADHPHFIARGLPEPARDPATLDDVALLAYLDNPTTGDYGLPAIAERLLLPAPADAGQRARVIAAAAPLLRARAEASGQWPVYRDLDLPLLAVLEAMETAGVKLEPAPLAALSRDLDRRCQQCQEAVFELAGTRFNLNSPQQLADVLFHKLGLPAPPRRGKTKSLSTASEVLEDLAGHPVVPPILEFRQLAKLKSTYADALPPLISPSTGRLHTTFILTGSATGRIASTNPNLQNIPIRSEIGREIRAAFVPAPGHLLLAADYSQIELRLLAHFSQDPLLLAAYRRGDDIHSLTAAEVFGVPPLLLTAEHRRRAKAVNFGIVYGLSAFGLARQLGIPQAEAAQFIQRYFERYAGVRAYIQRELETARTQGRVRTLFGRIRPIPNLDARNPALRGFAERTAINSPLQGTAADLIKLAMIRLHPQLAAHAAHMVLQVHDELVFEVPAAHAPALARAVRQTMEHVAALAVPLRVEIGAGPNWRDLAPFESD
jgi:DNA polymerase-1